MDSPYQTPFLSENQIAQEQLYAGSLEYLTEDEQQDLLALRNCRELGAAIQTRARILVQAWDRAEGRFGRCGPSSGHFFAGLQREVAWLYDEATGSWRRNGDEEQDLPLEEAA
jgi:hypothetical protein